MGFTRAKRIVGLDLTEIVQLSERSAELRAAGRDIVALSTGEPDFPTPLHVIEAADAAARSGETRYPPTAGTAPLRSAIAAGAGVSPREVIVSTGAKQVIANALLATLDPGDEVIVPAPYWTSYPDIVALAGGVPVVVPCAMARGFKLTPEALESAITPRTRWLMLNSPSNPAGTTYSAEELVGLAQVLARHPHILILVDEIYALLSYVPFASFRRICPELATRTLIVDGVSKAYAMTGWRIGWGIGHADLVAAMAVVQGQTTSGACSIAQAAALAALTGDQSCIATRREAYRARRDRVVAALNRLPGVSCPRPDGAFYVFPHIGGAVRGRGFRTEGEFCVALMEQAGVTLVPGRAFGMPDHARLSFAYSDADLDEGLCRIAAFVQGGS
ncbi:MAG: pyridoxal phosphate-dependent aminotransferase [Gemmobacter sp.]